MPNKPTFEMPEFKESDFNPNLKMHAMSVSTQPGIVWKPIENGKRYDCMRCGNTSTAQAQQIPNIMHVINVG